MSTVARRTSTPMADMLEWLESNSPFNVRGLGLAPYVRVEDDVEDDMLTISGERREEVKEKNHRELHYGSFRRTVPLPPGTKVEDVTASYDDGVLEVRVPLGAPEPPSTKIPVTRAG